MTLLDYWPTPDRVNDCVPTVAEALSDAVFLAVHQPTRLLRRVLGTSPTLEPAKEAALLEWLLSPEADAEGHRVVPIVGQSGTGKSHLVRWLDIHIPRKGRHVIRIPKSSSLKRVLELILQDLDGQAYAAIREELLRARDHLSLIAAEETLLANFRTALRERLVDPTRDAQEAQQNGRQPDKEIVDLLDQGKGLLAVLQGKTWEALLNGPVCQAILHGVLDGHAQPSDADTQFAPDHFLFSGVRADQVATEAKGFLTRLKMTTKDKDRVAAAALMNEVRDAAIFPMLGLGPGRLSELFRDVRRELLREKRELVVLIEDFAALAGIQKALLDVIIEDGVRGGKRVLCTMRTALAVTDGYLSPWDTVRTRTKDTEWVIAEAPTGDDAATVRAFVNLVGAYLNAARVGAKTLEDVYLVAADPTREDWVPLFDRTNELTEEGRRQLAAFGDCDHGRPLFPFNREAIEQLARRTPELRTPDKQLRLNPRRVLNHILRATLINHRSAFADDRFPPPGFARFSPNELPPDVKTVLAGRAGDVYDRTAALLGFWGGLPQTPEDVRLAPEVCRAFSLEPLPVGPVPSEAPIPPVVVMPIVLTPPVSTTPVTPATPAPNSPPPHSTWPLEVVARTAMLRRWIGEYIIIQTDANWIRGEVLRAADAAIDWDAEMLKPPRITSGATYTRWVYLPQAKGGEPTCTAANALVTVCDDVTFADPLRANEVELDLRALVRFHALGHFDYDGGAIDQARYANFVERAARQAVAFVRTRYERLLGDPVPAVAQALLVSARVLNLPSAHAADDSGLVETLLSRTPDPQTLSQDESRWSKLRRACAAERERARSFLLRRVSARQGGADSVYAVDAARLLAAFASTRKTWMVEAAFAEGQLEEDARMVRTFVQSMRPEVVAAAVENRRNRLATWGDETRQWLGADFDKTAVIEALRETVTQAVAADVLKETGEVAADRIRGYIDDFRKAAVAEALGEIERLTPDAAPGLVLSVLARVDDRVLDAVDRLREEYTRFLDLATVAVSARLKANDPTFDPTAPEIPADADAGAAVQAATSEIDKLLGQLCDAVQELAASAPVAVAGTKPRRPARRTVEGGAS